MDLNVTKIKSLDAETIICLSRFIAKMGIAKDIANIDINSGNEEKDNAEVAKQLFVSIISNLHTAEDEFYEFISVYKKISVEEAKKADVIAILKEILGINGITDFLPSA